MRAASILILLFFFHAAFAQELVGKYRDHFGYSLQLNEDSTFRFDWKFDLIREWATGKWTSSGHLINFEFRAIYDTLIRPGRPDTLVLSSDEISNKINSNQFLLSIISSGGQRIDGFNDKLFQKGRRLFPMKDNGKLNRKRHQGIWPQKKWPWGYKKWPVWYSKRND